MRRLIALLCALLGALVVAAPARAHDCSTWVGTCSFSEVLAMGGPALTRVHTPTDVAVAPDGRVAVADSAAYRALVLDASGAPQFATGGETHWVNAVAFGPDGDLWASTDGHIRRYGRDGTRKAVITEGLLRGDAATGNQSYARIAGMAVDGDGRLYAIADEVLMVYAPDGRLEREVRRAAERGFSGDWLIGADGHGRVLVSNMAAGTVEQLDATGQVTATLSELPPGYWRPAADLDGEGRLHLRGETEVWTYDQRLVKVAAVAHGMTVWDGAMAATRTGFIFTDGQGNRLRRIDGSGASLPAWGTERGNGLSRPESLDVEPDGATVVADPGNHRIVRFRPDGSFDRVLRDFGAERGESPLAVAVAAGDDLFVTYDSGLVERLAPDGTVRVSWRVTDSPYLRGIAVAPDGSVWIRNRGTLLRFSADGLPLARVEAGLESTYAAGNGLAVDEAGDLYAAQTRSIRKLSPSGQVLREFEAQLAEGVDVLPGGVVAVAGQRGLLLIGPDGRWIASWGDHETPAGLIHLPYDIAVDGAGRVHVADRQGHKVVRFSFAKPGAGAPPVALPPVPVAPTRLRLRIPAAGARVARSGLVTLRLGCRANGPRCRGDLRISRRTKVLAAGRFNVAAGRTRSVRLRLRAGARRTVRSARRLRVAALATTPAGERVKRTFVLRAAGV